MSKFGESLAFIKSMCGESIYHTNHEDDFYKKYFEAASSESNFINQQQKSLAEWQQDPHHKSQLQNYAFGNYYENLYASFLIIYEIELVLDEIEYDSMFFHHAENLMTLCDLLRNRSTNMMIAIDEKGLSFSKYYSLCDDYVNLAKNIYDTTFFFYSLSSINTSDALTVTLFDINEARLYCKYIRNGISVVKLFCILALMHSTPMYSSEENYLAKTIMEQLQEILYNKRIIKMVVDPDLYGNSSRPHSTTLIKIFFAMGNSDRYCIRLDFPHEGENTIHLNINEPAHKRSTGFPFTEKEYSKVVEICEGPLLFEKLFYRHDGLYWFRSNYIATLKSIDICETQKSALEEFFHKRGHIAILDNKKEHLDLATTFSEEFAELMIDYLRIPIYGITSSFDEDLYKYIFFQDYIFEVIVKIKESEIFNQTTEKIYSPLTISKFDRSREETRLKQLFCKYICKKLPDDEELVSYTELDCGLNDFISKCLDRIDKLGL